MSIEISEKSILLRRFLMVAYGLSEADVDAFMKIVNSQEGKDVDAISSDLGISKSRASLILKKLADAGLVEKQKNSGSKGGRPKFMYYVDKKAVIDKMLKKSQEVCKDLSDIIQGI
ncbi:MarR family transcriptional regulator [Acidianus sulfidivorans JP7]|uniref:TrmB family transcriptional regulator n=1 Tax=Acidianus sulfidivorans JP7 TaxID=619593 RepID=A0A2U9IN65_9CREN|nr:helix-turn-helix domain-containing protein [Acidianus sulfidivorans]AWR97445.1 MarR family transcriptional regulator [Acidianus sulfidivorans JP7]